MSGSSSDQELMVRVSAGDRAAFDEVYLRYQARIHAYLWRIVNDDTLAADLRQETFIRLWKSREDWRAGSSIPGYLIRVARNLALDAMRRRRVRDDLREDQVLELYRDVVPPDVVLSRKDRSTRIHAAIAALPDRPREVFTLKHDAGLSYREIAELLDISPKTVEVHMGRALRLLREALADLRAQLPDLKDRSG